MEELAHLLVPSSLTLGGQSESLAKFKVGPCLFLCSSFCDEPAHEPGSTLPSVIAK